MIDVGVSRPVSIREVATICGALLLSFPVLPAGLVVAHYYCLPKKPAIMISARIWAAFWIKS
jgi:hypothetical protein